VSGEKFYQDALRNQAYVYFSGDVYYYTALAMIAEDLPVMDPGHYIEALCKPKLVELMNQWKQENECAVSIFESEE
ncbi:Nif3-like dinuclear metal center hexameric protein, partial [Enterococcus faecalis]|uniref:Nif3-like dinuclear metal center hexameric protein n=1 Tax=Enterococcus faecalis TaxID=1351 RepID=UPI003D6AA531